MFFKLCKAERGQPPVYIVDSIHREINSRQLFFYDFRISHSCRCVRVRINDKPRRSLLRDFTQFLVAQMPFFCIQFDIRTVIRCAFRYL